MPGGISWAEANRAAATAGGHLATLTSKAAPSVFQNYAGFLDAKGRGSATLVIPNIPALVGIKLQNAFLVQDPQARSNLAMISNTVQVEIRS